MKYDYISTTVLESGINGNWKTYHNPKQPICDFLNVYKYLEVFIKIKPSDADAFFIKSNQIYGFNNAINIDLETFFDRGFLDSFIPDEPPPSDNAIQYLNYTDMEKENFQIILDWAELDKVPAIEPLTSLPDIGLFKLRYETDMSKVHTSCLVAVNGFLHQTAIKEDPNETFVLSGGNTSRISGYRRLSLLSFDRGISEIEKIPLSNLTVRPIINGQSYYSLIEFTDIPIDLTDKQVLLSLGGYLFVPAPNLFSVINSNSFTFAVNRIDIERKIVEASRYIDIRSLNLDTLVPYSKQSDNSILRSDDVIKAFINLSQSFLIIIPLKNTNVYTNPFIRNEINKIETIFDPRNLITSRTGRIVSYWNDGQYQDSVHSELKNTLILREFEDSIPIYKSSIYDKLIVAYPKLTIREYDLVNNFISIGFHNY